MPGLAFHLSVGFACLMSCLGGLAQTIHAPASERIRAATRPAGIIFRGTVFSVARIAPAHANQLETVEIRFHVDEGLRGVKTGSTLRIREWAGLWTSDDRYRVGERVALFLYPPSRLGLTSPVGGDAGRFPVDDSGGILVAPSLERPALASTGTGSAGDRPIQPSRTLTPREFRQSVRKATEY